VRGAGLDPVIEVDGGENRTTAAQAVAAGRQRDCGRFGDLRAKDYKAAIAAIRGNAVAGAAQP